MRYRVELSNEAQKQLARFPRDVKERIEALSMNLKRKKKLNGAT